MHRKQYSFLFLVAILTLLASVSFQAVAQTDSEAIQHSVLPVKTHPSQGDVREVEGGQAELFRSDAGITMSFRTNELEAGNIYTAWWVIINNPEACADNPCAPGDFLANPDVVGTEVTYADGLYMSDIGRMEFAGSLAAGDVPEGWFGNGLTNPLGAEIIVVIQDHGPAIPDMVEGMINTLREGCTDESVPAPYPDVAKADGAPGPNACALVQVAHFQPPQ